MVNPLTGVSLHDPLRPWWHIPDFDPKVGDIKLLWELSRFDWVLAFAQRGRQGDSAAMVRLNTWLQDWSQANAPYLGPNWKCGQEASLRVLHLAAAAIMLGQDADQALPGLSALLVVHLQRIAPTRHYAVAQDNNHGTSEAAALFVGGSWLATLGDPRGHAWAASGRALLCNRSSRLIGKQGTFSQYSLNYHRMMLDALSFAELWRLRLGEPVFNAGFQQRAHAAARWLYEMVDPVSGDGPNVGANDGARLFQLADTAYRDYRPSVQWALALFARQRAYAQPGSWDTLPEWLGVDMNLPSAPPRRGLWADDGGFAILKQADAMALLRYPRFRFRPSQADALHVDLWVGGLNLLRDAGTYSYNTDPASSAYFTGTEGHNTVQFDERDQMPRLSRFLFGAWLRAESVSFLQEAGSRVSHAAAAYKDHAGARHERRVTLVPGELRVEDRIGGFARQAVLRWRLAPGQWKVLPTKAESVGIVVEHSSGDCLSVSASIPLQYAALVLGEESRHYYERTPVPVLEVAVNDAAQLTSVYNWKT
ncbi:heparinase II/III-family protein [Pseudomonas sp. PA27(2017)]|uniref:heparinase II/III family protein n=1 Tax=Pseudomonas sp. PA27(2017) TaxID=1932112 RepID=UPI0021147E96|nr:heparinase II/III-family protein [Pseudomonas sp. PA27(2017)]